ncbi:3-hydroxyisobutyrate dehydrogenase [Acrocarpospora pleiomorpha]|uniref:3-hydroxyisobutyrate dehydrogenase n=1 Tax=Acrocarpospora pleiomorpha TaxID=90975 RepID=A0A5M3XHJ5_9ACTN|nr:NAD(P)-dependent oxidoreductase [Acrocarpospora pleiomorpha]GES19131.1 3-hydroxyisobutyrate dehydrogenase [Acrocarpospora pleiomorpha]
MTTVGWLGTGRMGTALAARLLDAGHELIVWNRTAARTRPLAERGAAVAATAAELGACDIVFVTVGGPADLVAVTYGQGGVLTGPRSPGVLVDCSTVSVETSDAVRAACRTVGSDFLAAPVSGNPAVVAAGAACIVTSGPAAVHEFVRPWLSVLAGTVVHAGEAEQSRLVKLCHNLYLGVMVQALLEVTSLAEKAGTDRAAFVEFLGGTVLGSPWVRARAEAVATRDWEPTFTMEMLRKDFELGLGAARELAVPMPLAAAVQQLITSTIGHGLAEADLLALDALQSAGAGLTEVVR